MRNENAGPEWQLLLICVQSNTDSHADNRIHELILSGIDWPVLLKLAERHRVLGHLSRRLIGFSNSIVPDKVSDLLSSGFVINGLLNSHLAKELLRIIKILESKGINTIAYKGPALTKSIYGNLAMRPSIDLDVIVPKSSVLDAQSVLEGIGYEPSAIYDKNQQYVISYLCGWETGYFRSSDDDVSINDNRVSTKVELHWNVSPVNFGFNLNMESIWERAECFDLFGTIVKVPSANDMFLMLCVHAAKHSWSELQLISTLFQFLMQRPETDIDFVIQQSHKLGAKRIVIINLLLVKATFSMRFSPSVEKEMEKDRKSHFISQDVLKALIGDNQRTADILFAASCFRLRERTADKIKCIVFWIFIPVPDSKMALPVLPEGAWFLYFLVRPVLLLLRSLKKHLRSVSARLTHAFHWLRCTI